MIKSSRQLKFIFLLFDVECGRVLERFKLKNLKYVHGKVLALRIWQMIGIFFNQPELWLLTANVKETTVKSIGNARLM